MRTCEEHNCIVIYEERKCPVCALIADHENTCDDLRRDLSNTIDENTQLEEENTQLQAIVNSMKELAPHIVAVATLQQ